jgi:DNA-binding beta-propeller fold protein YncE
MNESRALIRSALAAATLVLAACGSDGPTNASTTHLVVTPAKLTLGLGMSRQLSAAVVDEGGVPLPGATLRFLSTDPSRASVTGEGVVTYAGVGDAEIRVSSNDLLTVIPYTGLRAGHPLGSKTTWTRLPGDGKGDGPFGAAVDGQGDVFISQTNSGRVASILYPATDFTTQELGGSPTSIALVTGGIAVVTPTGPDTNQASVIDLLSGRILAQVSLLVSAFSAITSRDSQTVYLGTNDGRVLALDAVSSQVVGSIDLGVPKSRANHLALNPAGTLLYASSFTTGSISEIDLASGQPVRIFIVGGQPQGIALSLDGTELYVANEAGTGEIDIYDLVGDTLETSIPSGATSSIGGPFGLALSPDGATVYVGVITNEGPGLIHVINAASRTIEQTITSCGSTPRQIAFGFSGGLAVIANEDGCVNFVE